MEAEIKGSGREKVLKELHRKGLILEGEIKRRCPVDTGRLRSSYNTDILEDRVRVGTNVVYAESIEFGTAPFHPPSEPIKEWVSRVMAVDAKDVDSVAWAIITKISRQGISPQPHFRPAIDFIRARNV